MLRRLLVFGMVFLFGMIEMNASDQRTRDICERLTEEDFYSDENRKWYILCQEWIGKDEKKQHELVQDEAMINESRAARSYRPRRASRSRRGRYSRYGYRGFRSRTPLSSPSITRFRNIRTGAALNRPQGWQWSRVRSTFLPTSRQYYHRSYSRYSQYSTPATSSVIYYYCALTENGTMEIQCSNATGDSLCCEDEATQQVSCCGGQISEDFVEDANRAAYILTQVFCTLAAVTLCIHVFIRRFY